jgi:PAS domain-containing protein
MSCPFDHAGIAMAVLHRDGRCLRANRAMERLGVDPGRLIAEQADLGVGEVVEYDLELPSRWLLVTVAGAEPDQLVVTARDISARKAAEAQLRESEATLRLAFEESPVGVTIGDADGARARTAADVRRQPGSAHRARVRRRRPWRRGDHALRHRVAQSRMTT